MLHQHAKQHGTLVRRVVRGKEKTDGDVERGERSGGWSARRADGSQSMGQGEDEKGALVSKSPERAAGHGSNAKVHDEQEEKGAASRCASPELGGFDGAARSPSSEIGGSEDARDESPDLLGGSSSRGLVGSSSSLGPPDKECPKCDGMVSAACKFCEVCGYNFQTGKPRDGEPENVEDSAPTGGGSNEEGSVIADSCADAQSNNEAGSLEQRLSGSR